MFDDPIIEELHRATDDLGRRFAGDPHALFEFLRETQRADGQAVVALEPSARTVDSGKPSAPDETSTSDR